MNGLDLAVAAVAEQQYGAFSRAQAAEAGLSEYAMTRRVISGAWETVFPSIYRLPGTPRTGRQRAMAASLWAGEDALVSHTTSGRLLRLDGIRTKDLHLSVGLKSGLESPDVVLHRTGTLTRPDRVTVDGIRCTSATRSLIDSAALLDDEALEVAYESARRMGSRRRTHWRAGRSTSAGAERPDRLVSSGCSRTNALERSLWSTGSK